MDFWHARFGILYQWLFGKQFGQKDTTKFFKANGGIYIALSTDLLFGATLSMKMMLIPCLE